MRRVTFAASVAAILAAVSGTAGARPTAAPSWAAPQIATVVAAGLMAPSVSDFRPDEPLTRTALATILASLGAPDVTITEPDRLVTMRELDAHLVQVAGLRPSARAVRLAAVEAGLAPRPWLGTETVARMLGLRINHEMQEEELELQLSQPATRAEVAYSVARLLVIGADEVKAVRQAVTTFAFPALTDWQRAVLTRSLRFVGSPYVWAGTSEKPQQLLGKLLPGGFDCSGFVWRVFKLEPFAGAAALGQVLKGRSSFEMSGEAPRSSRLTRAQLAAGDVAFFGSRGPRSRPAEVGHMGIYLGNGWLAHSSRFGTTLVPMTGWYETSFAWGRSPLAEAGVSPPAASS